jgi:hypothetical protein
MTALPDLVALDVSNSTLWFVYASGLISVGSIAMLSEGVDTKIVAKTFGCSLCAAFLIFGDFHLNQVINPAFITNPSLVALGYHPDPVMESSESFPGVDFNPTCGVRASIPKTNTHTEFAKNDGGLKSHC